MWRMKKWLVGALFSCISVQVNGDQELFCSHPRIVPENVTLDARNIPVETDDIDDHVSIISTNKEDEEEERQDVEEFPSFRYILNNKESGNLNQTIKEAPISQRLLDPEEEFSFWPCNDSVPKEFDQESDKVFSQWPPNPEEDFDFDEDDLFECLQVNIDTANRRKQFGISYEEEEEHEKQNDQNLHIDRESGNQAEAECTDEISEEILDPEECPYQRYNPRMSFDARSTSRCIAMDQSCSYSSANEEEEEHEKQDDQDLHIDRESGNQVEAECTDGIPEEILDPEEPYQRRYNPRMRISYDARSTSRCIAMDQSCSYSAGFTSASSTSSSTSSHQHKNKPNSCLVPRQITKVGVLFSKISRGLRAQKTAFWRLLPTELMPVPVFPV